MRLLVVGAGSIGIRHLRNLRGLGSTELAACDPSAERRRVADGEGVVTFAALDAGLAWRPAGVVVCTPPYLHIDVALRAVAAGAHVFIEKPIATSAPGVDLLIRDAAQAGRIVLIGYNLRFHEGLRRVKALVDTGAVGRVLTVRAEFGQYLPDWRPGQDYREGYLAQPESGGIVLDGSHEIDYVRWIAGEVDRVSALGARLSDLELPDDDTVMALMRLRTGVLAHVHLDCVQRAYARGCKVVGAEGSVVWDYATGVRLFDVRGKSWQEHAIAPDVNDMYVAEMRHWLECLRGEAAPLTSATDALRTLEVALAIRVAAKTGREIVL